MRRQDLLIAAVALAACAVAFGLTFRFTSTTPAAMMSGMGAEFFPRLVIGVMAVLAVCVALGIGNPGTEKPERVPGIVWITIAILAVYIGALEIAGMWLASFVLMVGLGWLWGERNLLKLSLIAGCLLLVIWGVFVKFLKGGFPAGLWS
jgi:hypothetical protein